MNRNFRIFFLLSSILLLPFFSNSKGFGSSFGGGFLGGFSGSIIGNAVSQPRQPRGGCEYRQPVQTRVVEVHRPTYVEVHSGPSKAEKRYRRAYRNEEIIQGTQKTQAQEPTMTVQQQVAEKYKADHDLKMKELALKEKEIELKKAETDLAKAQAENEKLKLELQKSQAPR
jgi:hypothetical protein